MADNQFLIFTEMGEVALATPAKEVFSVFSRFRIPVQPAQHAFAHPVSMPLPTRSVCLCPPAKHAFAHPVVHKGILHIRYKENFWLYVLDEY
jgi:hypothetical protein